MSLTEEQKAERLNYVTGSDAAVICGVSPWGNIIELWQQKLGLLEQEDISWKPAVKAGNYLEPVVAQWFEDETGKKTKERPGIIIHPQYPWMAGNIDRLIDVDIRNSNSENAILECKTSSRDDGWGIDGDNTIPDYYLCQVAHYVAVCDVERAYIAVLIRGSDFRWYTYERNHKLEEMLIAKEKAFWECVTTQTPPEPRTTDEIISLYSQANSEEPLIADPDIESKIEAINALKAAMSISETRIKELEAIVKLYMKDKDTLLSSDGKMKLATWKNAKGSVRFDAKTFAKEHEKLYEKYLKSSEPSRRFLIK